MKNAVFWDVTPCDSCRNRRLVGTYRLNQRSRNYFDPDDEGDTFLRDVGSYKSR
jgi:hypothetical protein